MASPYLQFDKLTALATQGGYSENPHLSQMSAVFLLSACWYLQQQWIWQSPLQPISDATWNDIMQMIQTCEGELMTQYAVGSIIPSICEQNGSNLLLLDGSSVLASEYPQLAACVPAAWISGAMIDLPDMTDAGLFGTDDNLLIGGFAGENAVTLDESEMPSHTHTQQPHSHTYVQPVVTPITAGIEPVPGSLTTPTPTVTGSTVAVNNATGGDQAHNNVQRSLLVYYYIVAG